MKIAFLVLLLFFFVQSDDILYKHTNSDSNLYFVFTTFRHGARFPFSKQDYFGNESEKQSMFKNLSALKFTSFICLVCIIYTTITAIVEFFIKDEYFNNVHNGEITPFEANVSFFKGFPYMTCAFTAHYNVLRFY